MECNVLSVNTTISRFVSNAVMKVDPLPILRSPAELVGTGDQSVKDSELENRISKGSWTVVPIVLVPKAMMCLELSETITCFATVGALLAPATSTKSTALAASPPLLSQ
jgi:hypothetical protein